MGRRPTLFEYLSSPDSYPQVERIARRAADRQEPAPRPRPQVVPRQPEVRPGGMMPSGEINPFPGWTQVQPPSVPFAVASGQQFAPGQELSDYLMPVLPPPMVSDAEATPPMGGYPGFAPPDAPEGTFQNFDPNTAWAQAWARTKHPPRGGLFGQRFRKGR